jgi:tetratricopeptide (TPR) repeat protein
VFQDGTRRGVWSVQETNSLEGVKVVAGNLIEVSSYVLAISLWTAGNVNHVEKAAGILERLSIRMASQSQGANFPNLVEFKQKTGNYLRHVYWGLTNYYLVQRRDYRTALIWAQKLYELGPRNYDTNMHMARIAWELGDQSAARTYTKTARIAKPKEALPYLNLAFFHFYNGSYSKALAYYKHLNEKVFKTNIIDVVDFLEREYDKTGKEALYFAAGWLSYRFGDKERGRVMLLEFKEHAKNHGELEKLVKEVDSLELGE